MPRDVIGDILDIPDYHDEHCALARALDPGTACGPGRAAADSRSPARHAGAAP